MITKEELSDFITQFQSFENSIKRIGKAITGRSYSCNLFESDWYVSVEKMLDTFVNSHFTGYGADYIYYFMFETIEDKCVTVKKEKDIFNEEQKIEYHLNSIDELWDFLLTDPELYFKNYNKDE